MPLPIIWAYEYVQQYLMSYRDQFSKPQYKYFVIVLLGFIQCQQARTLSGLQRGVAEAGSLSGLSSFFKEELGLDQYQLMSATALVRFWSLALLAYASLDEERVRLQASWQRHVTIDETCWELQHLHRQAFLLWLQQRFREGDTPDSLFELLSA